MSDLSDTDLRRYALMENLALLHGRACEALSQREAQEFANVLARCAQRMGLSPPKQSVS